MQWIGIKRRLPLVIMKTDDHHYDVWVDGGRVVDAEYEDGSFYEMILDHNGYYSHRKKIHNITHWLEIEEPS